MPPGAITSTLTITITTHGPIINLGSHPQHNLTGYPLDPQATKPLLTLISQKKKKKKKGIATNHPSTRVHGASVAIQSNWNQLHKTLV